MSEPCNPCELCTSTGGTTVWDGPLCRVVLIDDGDYPGFCRVILNRHEREMTDLAVTDRQAMMRVVFGVESALRHLINPDKINLASLGNVTPHVHWHVIPRWREDRCFPNPIWGSSQRAIVAQPPKVDPLILKKALAEQLGEPIAPHKRSIP